MMIKEHKRMIYNELVKLLNEENLCGCDIDNFILWLGRNFEMKLRNTTKESNR